MLTHFIFEVDCGCLECKQPRCDVCNVELETGDDAIVEDCSPSDLYYHADCYRDAN